jgi:hypothetical protein
LADDWLDADDVRALPAFEFREEPARAVIGAAARRCGGTAMSVIVLSLVLTRYGGRRSRGSLAEKSRLVPLTAAGKGIYTAIDTVNTSIHLIAMLRRT